MHCYLDLVYQSWMTDWHPASIPLAPVVTGHKLDSVSIHWLPPIRGPLYQRYKTMATKCSSNHKISSVNGATDNPSYCKLSLNAASFYHLSVCFGSSSAASGPLISCGDCGIDGVFHQYAYEASSSRVCDTSGYWTPDEAIG